MDPNLNMLGSKKKDRILNIYLRTGVMKKVVYDRGTLRVDPYTEILDFEKD